MLSFIPLLVSLAASLAAAQQISFPPGTGVRSLWIPFKTVSGTPVASILNKDEKNNMTTYVVSCPTASPLCSLAPNITLTEGATFAGFRSSNSAGTATIGCSFTGTASAVCEQGVQGGGDISKVTSTIGADMIIYQAVLVTATMNNTSTLPVTVTVTPTPSSTTSSTSSSRAGVETMSSGPWAMGGAVGAGLFALAAL